MYVSRSLSKRRKKQTTPTTPPCTGTHSFYSRERLRDGDREGEIVTGEAQVFLWGCFVGVIIIQTKMSINHHIIEEYMFCMYVFQYSII